ncbi:uncharacterized protein LOC111303085 isoform X2 [Durio zibethinus]|uniref:Uncharacterized protein LOC111303085 isoform X2 n=1 Tax=Durio zibethinus TaxID=66656 RepID=A0A6P5ZQL1_DURZI|nr:uncharacterized protein LOC111303085 isoform X2 [Durio zibethinus]
MATSSKFDLSSDSPDRPLFTSGQRGAHLAAQLDRSGSFRETVENQILSSLPSMLRSSSVVAQGDLSNFFQCLRFDPKVVATDHKFSRQAEFKRHINVALGISADESPAVLSKGKLLPSPIPEEIKRVKAGLRDCSVKARERRKTFNEALSVFNKFFPSIPSKKRSRSESFSGDRPNALLSSDRSVLGPTIGKMGMHNHSIAGGFEFEQQKPEERPKSAVPNKRTRTSLVDVRVCLFDIFHLYAFLVLMDMRNNAPVRQPGNADRDREMLRVSNSGGVQVEDRTLSGGVDGWEKAKMKKKRSVIKPDVSPSMASTKPIEGYREPKQGIQQRAVTDARSRLINDSHGFRSGIANGSVGVGKSEGISQPTGLGPRSSVPRTDLDNSSLLNDRRDRPAASDKERVNLRAVNKMSVRDEYNSASPTSSTKMNASIRGPRSGPGVAPKLSPVVHRATASNDWELSHCANKPPTAGGANNRKRTTSARSSSPPVAHWASQRPQKSSRTARRTNLVPIVSSNDESPSLDTVSDMAGNESGSGFARRLSSCSPQQVKLKGDALFSAALSESEESGAAEIKSKEKVKKSDEIDEKAGQNVQKVSTFVLASRKNKLMTGEDIGDGIRRQGRTGRGITSTRSLMPMTVEKLGNVTGKQLRSARLGLDKSESKSGRPPTRKLTDRKAYARQKHAAINAAADLLVGSEDGHEELVAAVNTLISSAHAFPNSFWREMESFLGFITDADIAYLKQQGNYEFTKLGSTPVPSITDGCSTISNRCGLLEQERDGKIAAVTSTAEVLSQQLVLDTRDNNVIPLCQRFIAALIPEEDSDSGNEDLPFDAYETGFEMDGELGSNGLSHIVNFQSTGHASFNGYRVTVKPEHDNPEVDMLGNPGINSNFSHSLNDTFPNQPMPGMVCSEFQYESMKIYDKLFLEAQSIGIFLEQLPDIAQMEDDEICEDISKLEEKHNEQVSNKKGLLDKLLKAASETRAIQEKEFEQRALDKLVTMAYEKYMTCWGPNATGGKSTSNKMIKQAALAFVKRTLDQYHKFEDTGKSCFDEPMLRDMFLSGHFRLNGARSVDTPTDGESKKPCANSSTRSLEARTSASLVSDTQQLLWQVKMGIAILLILLICFHPQIGYPIKVLLKMIHGLTG